MKLWARALDPDFVHSERVARWHGHCTMGCVARATARMLSERMHLGGCSLPSLRAALLHDVGKVNGNKGHHKASLELIKGHGAPLGWNEGDMARAAFVARFHAGALPMRVIKATPFAPPRTEDHDSIGRHLRLADSLDAAHDGHIRRVKIESGSGTRKRT